MKRINYIISVLICFFAYTSIFAYPSGSPGGYSGAPSDGKTCNSCHSHSGTNTLVANWITSDIPSQGYTPGATYTITLTISESGAKGFEVSPQNASGTLIGTLVAGSGTKLVNSNKGITHSSNISTNPAVWTFQWKAPNAGSGDFSFYGVYNLGTSEVKKGKLDIKENTTTNVSTLVNNTNFINLYPNPTFGRIELDLKSLSLATCKINIYNSNGVNVYSNFYNNMTSTISIDLSNNPKGAYFLELFDGKEIYRREIILQ